LSTLHIRGSLKIGNIQLVWLNGGNFRLGGGAMFGAVPKILWQKSYPVDEKNSIFMCNDPLLIISPQSIVLVDIGLGNKLTEVQKYIFTVSGEWNLVIQLEAYGIHRNEVKQVVITHCDFDHAGGVETHDSYGEKELAFPKAFRFIQNKGMGGCP